MLAFALLGVGGQCCTAATELDQYQLPPENLSLNPADLAPSTFLWGCGRWGPTGQPTSRYVVADLIFGAFPGDPIDRPQNRFVLAVKRSGGRVLFLFNFNALRIYAPTDRIPAIVQSIASAAAFAVEDPRRYDWLVQVSTRGNPSESDLGRFRDLGGRVIGTFSGSFSGILPNRSVPPLRLEPNVSEVRNDVQLCPT